MIGLETLECVCSCVNRGCLYIENNVRKCVSNDYFFILTDSHSVCRNLFGQPNDSQIFTIDKQFGKPKLVRYAEWILGCALCKPSFGIPKMIRYAEIPCKALI